MFIINSLVKHYKIFDNYIGDSNKKNNWRKKLIDRYDIIDNNYLIIKGKYPIIDESINYYMEMLELSVFLLKKYDNSVESVVVQNKYIDNICHSNSLYLREYLDEKKLAEYLKMIFFNNTYPDINISELLYNRRKYFNYALVITSLIYPNYYFDIVDGIVLNKNKEEDLTKIVNKRDDYINYIKYIVNIVNSFVDKKIIIYL